jgi:16S rRNA (guanine527-N7)-methyltransferase
MLSGMIDGLVAASAGYGVRLDARHSGRFQRYLEAVVEWSARVNLVGRPDPATIVGRHMLESIALGAALRERELLRPGAQVADVGAGAGFPGVPIAIVWPVRLTLIEATAKKARFLEALVADLGLEDAEVRTGRAETLAHDGELRERFDLVLARAVAPLPALLELTLPFARVGGRVVTPKGSRAAGELVAARNALAVLGGRAFSFPLDVPGPSQTVIVVHKRAPTPAAYPRRPGMPTKSPL